MSDGEDGASTVGHRVVTSVDGVRSKTLSALRTNRLVRWLLFRGQRWLVVLALQAGVFAGFLALALLRPVDMERLLADTNTLQSLFVALLSGAILIVSVVSSISSIVLSQEMTDIETEQERIDSSIEFRRRAEEMVDVEGSPAKPAAFLQTILYSIYRETNALRAVAGESDDADFRADVQSFTEEVISEATDAAETLSGAKFGTFKVLSAGLYYDYAWQLNTAHRIRNRYADSLTDEEDQTLSDLIDTLTFFATGRKYFQSLYYKREVARLSRMLLYVSLPTIAFISYFMLALDTTVIPNARVGSLSTLSVFILFTYTVSLAPYLVLTAYVIRVAAITLRTLAVGPFTVHQEGHGDIVELDLEMDPSEWEDRVDPPVTDDAEDSPGPERTPPGDSGDPGDPKGGVETPDDSGDGSDPRDDDGATTQGEMDATE